MKEKIKEFRVRIDGLARLTKELNPCKDLVFDIDKYFLNDTDFNPKFKHIEINSKEIEKAVDSLYLDKAWLGKILGELSMDTPHANDGNRKTKKDIEPTSKLVGDHKIWYDSDNSVLRDNMLTKKDWENKSHIEKVDWLREEIKKVDKDLQKFFSSTIYIPTLYMNNILTHISEAIFNLGFELQRIKESK